jgi:SAM-dependent methyltransferase
MKIDEHSQTKSGYMDEAPVSSGIIRWHTQIRPADLPFVKPELAGRLAQADGRRLPFRDGSADVVLCTLTIGHMQPVGAALGELARITRPLLEHASERRFRARRAYGLHRRRGTYP